MADYRAIVFFAVLCWMLTATQSKPLKTFEVDLKPFEVIADCLPLNLKVEQSKDASYRLKVEAEKKIVDIVRHRVRKGVLTLGLENGFESGRIIKVTVFVPKNALKRIIKSSASTLVISPGMKFEKLTVMAMDLATVSIISADIDDLVVQSSGSSAVFADGRIDQVRLESSGTANVHIYGIRKAAEVFASDISKIYLAPVKSNVPIEGSVDGLSTIFITKGKCLVDGPFGSGCASVSAKKLPRAEAKYSCGLVVEGSIRCSNQGESSTTTLTGVTATAFSRTSGNAFASASSSTGGRTSASTSFSGSVSGFSEDQGLSFVTTDGQEAIAARSIRCRDDNIEMIS